MKKLTQNDLINFEQKVANLFNNKKIKSPVHLYSGYKKIIIKIFKKIKNEAGYCVLGEAIINVY